MSPPETLPEGFPEVKACPECFAEGRVPYLLPVLEKFYIKRSPRYKGGYRISAYCREHENKKRAENQLRLRAKLQEIEQATGVAPPALVAMRKKVAYRDMSEEDRKKQRKEARERRAAHLEEARARGRAWQQANTESEAVRKRQWYVKNREAILARQRAKRGTATKKKVAPAGDEE